MKKVSKQKWTRYFFLWVIIIIGSAISFSMTKENQFALADIFVVAFLLLGNLFAIFLFIKSIGRLKDVGISGWWMLLVFIPIIGWGSLVALLFAESVEHREEKISSKRIIQIILFGGGVAMAIIIALGIMIPDVDQNSVENLGGQINVDTEKGEVNVKKVNVNPDNIVKRADENVALYCGLKTREIEFNNNMYYLSFSKQITDNYYTMEFIAKGDISERYQEMILVHCNTSDVKPMQVLFSVMKGIQKKVSNGEARQYPISQNGQKVGFDFVVGEVDFFKEWNMFSYAPLPKAKTGILMFGISKRFYANDSDLDNFGNKQEELKKQYEDKLMNFPLNELF